MYIYIYYIYSPQLQAAQVRDSIDLLGQWPDETNTSYGAVDVDNRLYRIIYVPTGVVNGAHEPVLATRHEHGCYMRMRAHTCNVIRVRIHVRPIRLAGAEIPCSQG